MKQVYCLYRVSTNQQLDKNDIPMQREACRQFAEEHQWHITQEFYERGVSGYKVSANDRNILQQIKKDAAQKRFDILLVFMFDRLGRRDNETPFFVEELAAHGIEIWSAKEGQQRFDDHTDKLVNYVRFWQAAGESLKISIRTKTRLGQLAQEGKFCGGVCPYGYDLIKQGRFNKKGHELYNLVINESEAIIVKYMFDLCINHGYGGRRIASALTEQDIYNHQGKPFHYSSIAAILKNILYKGIMRSGDSRSGILHELQIIDEDTFDHAQKIIAQRSAKHRGASTIPRHTIGRALLSGNIFCGHCGGRMFATTENGSRYTLAQGDSQKRIPIYRCYNRTQHKGVCTGQTTYRAYKIDGTVHARLEEHLANISKRSCRQLREWASIFPDAVHEVKKMIASQTIKNVLVYRNDTVEVVFYQDWEIEENWK